MKCPVLCMSWDFRSFFYVLTQKKRKKKKKKEKKRKKKKKEKKGGRERKEIRIQWLPHKCIFSIVPPLSFLFDMFFLECSSFPRKSRIKEKKEKKKGLSVPHGFCFGSVPSFRRSVFLFSVCFFWKQKQRFGLACSLCKAGCVGVCPSRRRLRWPLGFALCFGFWVWWGLHGKEPLEVRIRPALLCVCVCEKVCLFAE